MRRLQAQIPRLVLRKVLQRRLPHRRNTVKEQKPPTERQEGSRPPRRRHQPTTRRTGTWRYTISNVQPRNSPDNVREPKPLPRPRWQATCQILLRSSTRDRQTKRWRHEQDTCPAPASRTKLALTFSLCETSQVLNLAQKRSIKQVGFPVFEIHCS